MDYNVIVNKFIIMILVHKEHNVRSEPAVPSLFYILFV